MIFESKHLKAVVTRTARYLFFKVVDLYICFSIPRTDARLLLQETFSAVGSMPDAFVYRRTFFSINLSSP